MAHFSDLFKVINVPAWPQARGINQQNADAGDTHRSAKPSQTFLSAVAPEGTNGIVHVLRSLLAEADLIMAVDGYPTLKDLRVDTAIRGAHPKAKPTRFQRRRHAALTIFHPSGMSIRCSRST